MYTGELLLAGGDSGMFNSGGCKARDLLLQTVGEEEEHRGYLLALLDRPVVVTRGDAGVHAACDAAAAAAAADVAAAVAVSDVRGGVRDAMAEFIDCIGRLDTQRFKALLGSHGLHHTRQGDGATLLHVCAQSGFLQGVCLLLQSKCPMRLDLHGCTAMHHAAAANHPLIVSELLCAFPSCLVMCNDAGDTSFITAVRAHAPAVIAVLTAVPSSSSSRAAALAKALASPGAEGLPPLHLAVRIGALRCAELLLNAAPSHANLHTPTVPHPLHVVAASQSEFAEGAAKLLLQVWGLYFGVWALGVQVIFHLLTLRATQAGSDISVKDSKGRSAADAAAAAGNTSLARILSNVAAAVADLAALKVAAL